MNLVVGIIVSPLLWRVPVCVLHGARFGIWPGGGCWEKVWHGPHYVSGPLMAFLPGEGFRNLGLR